MMSGTRESNAVVSCSQGRRVSRLPRPRSPQPRATVPLAGDLMPSTVELSTLNTAGRSRSDAGATGLEPATGRFGGGCASSCATPLCVGVLERRRRPVPGLGAGGVRCTTAATCATGPGCGTASPHPYRSGIRWAARTAAAISRSSRRHATVSQMTPRSLIPIYEQQGMGDSFPESTRFPWQRPCTRCPPGRLARNRPFSPARGHANTPDSYIRLIKLV
jgi:hypothetical protein